MTFPKIVGQTLAHAEDLKKLSGATKALEADLFHRFLKESIPKSTLFGKGAGSKIYEDMSTQALADDAAKHGGLGIADAIFRSIAPTILNQKTPRQ